jgi:hypothetical protein
MRVGKSFLKYESSDLYKVILCKIKLLQHHQPPMRYTHSLCAELQSGAHLELLRSAPLSRWFLKF